MKSCMGLGLVAESSEKQCLIETKIDLMECFVVESEIASFLLDFMKKHEPSLDFQETLRLRELFHRAHGIIGKIKADLDKPPPPDKLTVYL